ncbi:formate dehydrogenase subunit delta [Azospirillum sp. SYSU D00513]|uniref:formate dehydrogenase subunit delta n=1 Tax=Azospirillum sp. SYSU D00513 TaxID=2812561 RepID=UPI0032B4B02F
MDDKQTVVRMANQIATFFEAYPLDEAATETAAHIQRFWPPRMRQALITQATTDTGSFHAVVLQAIRQLQPAAAS